MQKTVKTTLQRLIEYCNARANQQFTRKDMLKAMFFSGATNNTIDSYRRYLTAAGFLETVSTGVYFVKTCIPTMEVDELRRLANYKVNKPAKRQHLADFKLTKL